MTTVYYQKGVLTTDTKVTKGMSREEAQAMEAWFLENVKGGPILDVYNHFNSKGDDAYVAREMESNGKRYILRNEHRFGGKKILAVGMAGNAGLAYSACEYYDEVSNDFVNDILKVNFESIQLLGKIAASEFIFVTEDGAFTVDKNGELVKVYSDEDEAIVIGSGRVYVHGFSTVEEEVQAFNTWTSEEFYKVELSADEIRQRAVADTMTNNDWRSVSFH